MKRHVILLLSCVALYLAISAVLQLTYGPSYGWLEGENRWEPDGSGGWIKRGSPDKPMPAEPSEYIPILLLYLPVFIPTALLVLFLFTPLSRRLETPKPPESETKPESAPPEP